MSAFARIAATSFLSTLLATLFPPVTAPAADLANATGKPTVEQPEGGLPEAFNSSQFQQGFSAGPKIDLIYRGDSGYGVELSYFNIFNQSATNATGP